MKGVVQAVSRKSGKGKRGNWEMVSLQIEGEWYGGFVNDDNTAELSVLAEGDTIELTGVEISGKYKNYSGVNLLKEAPRVAGKPAVSVQGQTKDYRMHCGGIFKGVIAAYGPALSDLYFNTKPSSAETERTQLIESILLDTQEIADKMWGWTPPEAE